MILRDTYSFFASPRMTENKSTFGEEVVDGCIAGEGT